MCAYNKINDTPACAYPWLLQTKLRQEWGFRGFVVSDCGAVEKLTEMHEFTPTYEAGAAKALRAGTDLNCGDYNPLINAVAQV